MKNLKNTHEQKQLGRGKKLSPPLHTNKTSRRKANTTSDEAVVIPSRLPDVLRHIRRVRKFGWAILPVVGGGKAPAVKGGYRAASKDRKKVEAFFAANLSLNYGIVTCAVSGFFALDIDGPEGQATLAEHVKKHGPLPKTITVITPHGEHRLFKSPGYPVPNSVGRLGHGIDVRGDGATSWGQGAARARASISSLRGMGQKMSRSRRHRLGCLTASGANRRPVNRIPRLIPNHSSSE